MAKIDGILLKEESVSLDVLTLEARDSVDNAKLLPINSDSIDNALRINDVLYNVLDFYTGEALTFKKITKLNNGTIVTDADVDNIIIKKNSNGEYFKRNITVATPQMFGVVGGGIVDDTVNLQKLLRVTEAKIELEKDGKYLVSGTIFNNNSNVLIDANNATIIAKPGFTPMSHVLYLNNRTTKKFITTTAVSVVKGVKTVTLPDVTGIVVGDMIEITGGYNHDLNGVTYSYGHVCEVKEINGFVVTFSITPEETFTSINYKIYTPSRNIVINDLNIEVGDQNVWGLNAQKVINLNLTRCKLKAESRKSEVGLLIGTCIDVTIRKAEIEGFSLVGTTQQLGYGIAVSGHNILVENNNIKDAKHCLTSGSRNYLSTGIRYLNNILYGADVVNGNVLDFHGNCRGIARGNEIYAIRDTGCINVRDGGIDIMDNTMFLTREGSGETIRAIYFGEMFFGNSIVSNNKVFIKTTTRPTKASVIEMNTPPEIRVTNFKIINNTSNNGIYSLKRCDADVVIKDNVCNNEDGQLSFHSGIIVSDSKQALIKENTLRNNHTTIFNYGVQIDPDSNADVINNKIYRIVGNTSPSIRINSIKNKICDNDIYLDTSIGSGGIMDYTTTKENLISNNNRVTSAGVRSILAIGTLPTATDFFLGQSTQLLNSGSIEQYYVERNSGTFVWKRATDRLTYDTFVTATNTSIASLGNSSLPQGAVIGDTEDLDTILTTGIRVRGTSTGNTTDLNYPVNNIQGGNLIVFKSITGNISQIYQTRENRTFTRFMYSTTFTAWKEIFYKDDYAGVDVTSNITTASPSLASLNTNFGTKKLGYTRIYPYLTDGPRIYYKLSEAADGAWGSIPLTLAI